MFSGYQITKVKKYCFHAPLLRLGYFMLLCELQVHEYFGENPQFLNDFLSRKPMVSRFSTIPERGPKEHI